MSSPSTHKVIHQRIIAQNNESVSLIARGDYEEAIVGFTSAISQWKCVIYEKETGERSTVSSIEKDDEDALPSLDKLMASSSMACPTMSNPLHGEEDDEHTEFLYKTCILFPLDLDLTRCEDAFVASVIVFNLALAHQLWARSGRIEAADSTVHTTVNTHRKVLVRASHLYNKCFHLAKEYSQYPKGSVLFQLAIANNMGVLYRALGSHESTLKCFQYVLATLMVLTAYRNHTKSRILQNTSEDTIGGFFANTTVLVARAIAAPAA